MNGGVGSGLKNILESPVGLFQPPHYLPHDKLHRGGRSSLVLKCSKVCELRFQVMSGIDLENGFLSTRVSPGRDHLIFFQLSNASTIC